MQNRAIARLAPQLAVGMSSVGATQHHERAPGQLYTPAERLRRDASPWTLVQGILAPVQFLVFLVSLALVVRYFVYDTGLDAAKQSVVVKTLVLYLIMITGAIWEKEVFGQYLFAPMFWWEDFVSMGVIALHTFYLAIAYFNFFTPAEQLAVALAAYATYVINAAQFVYKLRLARLGAARAPNAAFNSRGIAQ